MIFWGVGLIWVGYNGYTFSQPAPRFNHYSSPVGDQVYLFGGRTKDFSKEVCSSVHVFDVFSESWREWVNEGPASPGLHSGACASSAGENLYIYGGHDGAKYQGSLHKLNTNTLNWVQLATPGSGPMRKTGCKMISHHDHLLLFGGYGVPSGPTQPGSEFVKSTRYTGWTNELHQYDTKEGEVVQLVRMPNPQCRLCCSLLI